MISPGEIYVAGVVVLLLFALAVCLPVLKRVIAEGFERRRKWNSGEIERYDKSEEYDRGPPAALEDGTTEGMGRVCRQCGVENDPGYRYCRQCATEL